MFNFAKILWSFILIWKYPTYVIWVHCEPAVCQPNKNGENQTYCNIKLNENLLGFLDVNSNLAFKYSITGNVTKTVRVHVTRDDIDEIKKRTEARKGCSSDITQCSCSIVSIQKLDTHYNDREQNAVHTSIWQTMIGRSVIDIDVGPDAKGFKNGFYIVIIKMKNDEFCKSLDYDFMIDGDIDIGSKKIELRHHDQLRRQHGFKLHVELRLIYLVNLILG